MQKTERSGPWIKGSDSDVVGISLQLGNEMIARDIKRKCEIGWLEMAV
jgi:hypothetical protein